MPFMEIKLTKNRQFCTNKNNYFFAIVNLFMYFSQRKNNRNFITSDFKRVPFKTRCNVIIKK